MAKEQAEKTGLSVHPSLEPPELLDGYGGWYEDFWRLSTERSFGMGVGPIPASVIDRHVEGWHYEDAEIFEVCMREMDDVYMAALNKSEDATEAPPSAMSARDAFRSATSDRRGR